MNISEKYPRTYHLSISGSVSRDDKFLEDETIFLNKELVILEKLDGSNTCYERTGFYARSHSGPPRHPAFAYGKQVWHKIYSLIREDQQIFAEDLFAVHAIEYTQLPSYTIMIGVRECIGGQDGPYTEKVWLSWDDVCLVSKELSKHSLYHFPVAPLLWRGIVTSNEDLNKLVLDLASKESSYGGQMEGVVVRPAGQFKNEEFSKLVGKFVRKDHVIPGVEHWTNQPMRKQKIK